MTHDESELKTVPFWAGGPGIDLIEWNFKARACT